MYFGEGKGCILDSVGTMGSAKFYDGGKHLDSFSCLCHIYRNSSEIIILHKQIIISNRKNG